MSQLHSLVPCPRCPMFPWDYTGHPGMYYLRTRYTALSHVPDVPCIPGITRDILGSLEILGISWDVPGMSQLKASYTALSHGQFSWDISGCPKESQGYMGQGCVPGSYLGHSRMSQVIPGIHRPWEKAVYLAVSGDILGCPK